MYFLSKSSDIVLYVILFSSIVPILILSIVVLIKILVKRSKLKNVKPTKVNEMQAMIDIVGGKQNIISVNTDLSRVSIEVNSLEKVDMERLKSLNVGTLIVGNTIKCSSEKIALAFKSYQNEK